MKPLTRDLLEETFWWPVWRKWDALHTLWRHRFYIPHYYQRARYGVSREDVWSFDTYLAEAIVYGIRELRRVQHGYPAEMSSYEEWDAILAEMEEGFELIADWDWPYDPDEVLVEANRAKCQRALDLLHQYFHHLWW